MGSIGSAGRIAQSADRLSTNLRATDIDRTSAAAAL
jgi:hypothetical protein